MEPEKVESLVKFMKGILVLSQERNESLHSLCIHEDGGINSVYQQVQAIKVTAALLKATKCLLFSNNCMLYE